jgi:hypothetical protein
MEQAMRRLSREGFIPIRKTEKTNKYFDVLSLALRELEVDRDLSQKYSVVRSSVAQSAMADK